MPLVHHWSYRSRVAALAFLCSCAPTAEVVPCEGTWFADADGDGFGSQTRAECGAAGATQDHLDCDDTDGAIFPGAVDLCNGIDDGCRGIADPGPESWYPDLDGDLYGDPAAVITGCDPGAGWTRIGGDCDDTTTLVSPVAFEFCDGIDNDCDGLYDPDGSASWQDADGNWEDWAATYAAFNPDTDYSIALRSGNLYLCGGTWVVALTQAQGTDVTIVGRAGFTTPVLVATPTDRPVVAVSEDATLLLQNVIVTGLDVTNSPAVYVDHDSTATLVDVTLRENRSGGDASAVYASTGAEIYATRVMFQGNEAPDIGSVVTAEYAEFTDCTVQDNVSEKVTIDVTTATIRGTSFARNTAESGGALSGQYLTIESCDFEDNTARLDGGAVNASWAQIDDSTFRGNTAGDEGGAVKIAEISGSNSLFEENQAGIGGAINTSTLTMTDSTVRGNVASGDGGGIFANSVELDRCEISGNTADRGGGVRIVHRIFSTISGSTIADNVANEGAGLLVDLNSGGDEIPAIVDTTIRGNRAAGRGGGLLMADDGARGGDVDASGVTFEGNTAGTEGGGFLMEGAVGLTLTGCLLTGNDAPNGGAGIATTYAHLRRRHPRQRQRGPRSRRGGVDVRVPRPWALRRLERHRQHPGRRLVRLRRRVRRLHDDRLQLGFHRDRRRGLGPRRRNVFHVRQVRVRLIV